MQEAAALEAPTTEEQPHPLYEACVGFMVSDRSKDDAWSKVAQFVDARRSTHSLDAMKAEFKVVEAQIKASFDVRTLPTAWRSAKSTALSAMRDGVALLDGEGAALGKTEVSKLLVPRNVKVAPSAEEEAMRRMTDIMLHLQWMEKTGQTLSSPAHSTLLVSLSECSKSLGRIGIA